MKKNVSGDGEQLEGGGADVLALEDCDDGIDDGLDLISSDADDALDLAGELVDDVVPVDVFDAGVREEGSEGGDALTDRARARVDPSQPWGQGRRCGPQGRR